MLHAPRPKPAVILVGAGAVGCATAAVLARHRAPFHIIDRDIVDAHNLQTQILYCAEDLGHPKALVAARRLGVRGMAADVNAATIARLLGRARLILDATDTLDARLLLNDYCRRHRIPWIHAAALGHLGFVWGIAPKGPCASCLYAGKRPAGTCDTIGLLPSASLLVGCLQAAFALGFLSSGTLPSRAVRLDAWAHRIQAVRVARQPTCTTCRGEFISLRARPQPVELCGRSHYQFLGPRRDLTALARRLARLGPVRRIPGALHFGGHTFFADGRALLLAPSATRAKSFYARLIGRLP